MRFGRKLDSMVRQVHGCDMSKSAPERKATTMVTQSVFTGVWIACRLDSNGYVTAEKDFGNEYDAKAWLVATDNNEAGE